MLAAQELAQRRRRRSTSFEDRDSVEQRLSTGQAPKTFIGFLSKDVQMILARIVFATAGLYGIAVLVPNYFLEARIGMSDPPPITHPEYFYGFVGVALAWQFAFFLIALDPQRYRPLMPVAVLEKLTFGVPAVALFLADRLRPQVLVFGLIDLLLAACFLIAFLCTVRTSGAGEPEVPYPPKPSRVEMQDNMRPMAR
jgi:hypothetical protein